MISPIYNTTLRNSPLEIKSKTLGIITPHLIKSSVELQSSSVPTGIRRMKIEN